MLAAWGLKLVACTLSSLVLEACCLLLVACCLLLGTRTANQLAVRVFWLAVLVFTICHVCYVSVPACAACLMLDACCLMLVAWSPAPGFPGGENCYGVKVARANLCSSQELMYPVSYVFNRRIPARPTVTAGVALLRSGTRGAGGNHR